MIPNHTYTYTYVLNNPLIFTDPTGYYKSGLKEFWKKARQIGWDFPYSDWLEPNKSKHQGGGGGGGAGGTGGGAWGAGKDDWRFNYATGKYENISTGEVMLGDEFNNVYLNPTYVSSSTRTYEETMVFVKGYVPNGDVFIIGMPSRVYTAVYQASNSGDDLLPPVDLKYPITSPYTEANRHIPELKQNRPHRAIDIGTPVGTPVVSPWSGKVVMAKQTDYGLAVIIKLDYFHNGNFIQTGYAHLSEMFVTQGMVIQRGDSIGLTGTFGTGPHLHFTLRFGNTKVNPTILFPFK